MLYRIRSACEGVEFRLDERIEMCGTCIGGRETNQHGADRLNIVQVMVGKVKLKRASNKPSVNH